MQLQKENISYQKTRFLHLLQQKNTSEEQLEEICRDCGFVCARDENYLCMEIRFENETAQLEPCRTLLEKYLGDSTDFLLLDQMPELETAIAVLACQAKRQQEIRRKLHLFVAKYPEYTVAVGYLWNDYLRCTTVAVWRSLPWNRDFFSRKYVIWSYSIW